MRPPTIAQLTTRNARSATGTLHRFWQPPPADRATPIAILAASPWLWAHRPHRYGISKAPSPPKVEFAGFQSARRSLRKAIKKFAPQAEITAIAEDDEVCTAAASHDCPDELRVWEMLIK